MKKLLFLPFLAAMLLLGGCSSFSDDCSPSDLTVEELEAKIVKAMDPSGRYASCSSCIIRQEVKTPLFLDEPIVNLVETKLQRPDRFRITTYEDNQPVQVICSDGKRGWVADYSSRKVEKLDGTRLRQMLTFAKLANPGGGYSSIFDKVEICKCTNSGGEYYVLKCVGREGSVFRIYVDPEEFFIRRIHGDLKIGKAAMAYDSKVDLYSLREGVMTPLETEIRQNGQKQLSRIISYKLNVPLAETDFLPPVF